MRTNKTHNFTRFNPSYKAGLSSPQVARRKKEKLSNKAHQIFAKSNVGTCLSNVFSLYNLILLSVAGAMFYLGSFYGLYFAVMALLNIVINLWMDLKAEHHLNKNIIKIKINVIRDEKIVQIKESDIVLDEVLLLEKGCYISVDGVILHGEAAINEAFISGEAAIVHKNTGDNVQAGTSVVEGKIFVRADKVGEERSNYTQIVKAKMMKHTPAKLLHFYRVFYLLVCIAALALIGAILLVLYLRGQLTNFEQFKSGLLSIMNMLIMLVPGGLYLLSTLVLAIFAGKLAKKKLIFQDFYRLEALSGIDTLCFDKTGTLTDGTLVVKKTIIVNREVGEEYVAQAMSNLLVATKMDNPTAKALRKVYDLELSTGINVTLPFSSAYKYCGVTFKGGKTFMLGAPEFLPLRNKKGLLIRVEEFLKEGNRVLVLGESREPIVEQKFAGELDAVAIIVIKECIREGVVDTFKWFTEHGVSLKIISGDHPQIVSAVAQEAGIIDTKCVSLENLSLDKVKDLALRYKVFGHATPRQKEVIITALQESGQRVAMVGDGINDILALRRADCAIAMASGVDETRLMAQVVLKDNSFSQLPIAMDAGRRVVNNLKRVSSLFFAKTLFIFLLVVIFTINAFIGTNSVSSFPLNINQLLPWEVIFCGLAALLLAFENHDEKYIPAFFSDILKKAAPFAMILTMVVLIIFTMFDLQTRSLINFGIYSQETAIGMSALAINLLGIIYFYQLCRPFTKYRYIIYAVTVALDVLILGGSAVIAYLFGKTDIVLQIPYLDMGGPAYMFTLFITILAGAIYFLANYLVDVFKGESKKNEN